MEYPNGHPVKDDQGADIVLAVTGLESVGDAFDVAPGKRDSTFNGMDAIVVKELFRITNDIRILKLQGQLTLPQYVAFLKSLMP